MKVFLFPTPRATCTYTDRTRNEVRAPRHDRRFDVDEVKRAVDAAFSREFINRLDRVIVFRPLDRELMRKILHRELQEALSRRGLKGRRGPKGRRFGRR